MLNPREHEHYVAIHKLRRNRQLTPTDLTELERLLLEAGIADQQDLDRAAREASGLGLFVRSLVGLDRQSATAAFEEFLSGRTLSANQLDFVRARAVPAAEWVRPLKHAGPHWANCSLIRRPRGLEIVRGR